MYTIINLGECPTIIGREGLASKPDLFISVELRYLPEDTEPPVIVLDKPETIINPESKDTLFTFRDIREGDVIDIKGKAYDATGIAVWMASKSRVMLAEDAEKNQGAVQVA